VVHAAARGHRGQIPPPFAPARSVLPVREREAPVQPPRHPDRGQERYRAAGEVAEPEAQCEPQHAGVDDKAGSASKCETRELGAHVNVASWQAAGRPVIGEQAAAPSQCL
ncbi:hypothetical protein DFQ30_010897, partial [Apophysomyces sp. BC1015]